jgi:hypothetical protein
MRRIQRRRTESQRKKMQETKSYNFPKTEEKNNFLDPKEEKTKAKVEKKTKTSPHPARRGQP